MYFGTPEIVDPMNATNDPRRPIYFYPNKEGLYVGIASTHEGSAMEAEDPSEITEARFNLDNLFKSDYPDVICSYPEVMFYVAEAYVRGLGVTKDLTKADEYFKKGLEASCTNVGVAAADAKTFADGVPALLDAGRRRKSDRSHCRTAAYRDDDAPARSMVRTAPHGLSETRSPGDDSERCIPT